MVEEEMVEEKERMDGEGKINNPLNVFFMMTKYGRISNLFHPKLGLMA